MYNNCCYNYNKSEDSEDKSQPSIDQEEEEETRQEEEIMIKEATEEAIVALARQDDPVTKGSIEEEWDTDSDSNSTSGEPKNSIDENEPSQPLTDDHKDESTEDKQEEATPPVKLVISKKKGSIFKSRPLVTDVTKKRRALYKHKWSDDKDGNQKTNDNSGSNNTNSSVYDEFGFNDDPLTRVTVAGADDEEESVTSIKCTKSDKGVSGSSFVLKKKRKNAVLVLYGC